MAIGDIARQIFGISKPEYNDKVKYPAVTRGELMKYDELLSLESFPSIFQSIEVLANDTILPSGTKTIAFYSSADDNDISINLVPNPYQGKILGFGLNPQASTGFYVKYSIPNPSFPSLYVDPGEIKFFVYINGYWLRWERAS